MKKVKKIPMKDCERNKLVSGNTVWEVILTFKGDLAAVIKKKKTERTAKEYFQFHIGR